MIDIEKVLEKYPFLEPNEDGLTNVSFLENENILNIGIFVEEFFIPFSSDYKKYCGFHLAAMLLNLVQYKCNIFISLDLENIEFKNEQQDYTGDGLFGYPSFNIERLRQIKVPDLTLKIRTDKRFDHFFHNKLVRTEFFYEPRNSSFQVEEIMEKQKNPFKGDIYKHNRYFHTIFDFEDASKPYVSHLDGKILVYSEKQFNERLNIDLRKRSKIYLSEKKLFRIDGNIKINNWMEIMLEWFIDNELILEYIDPHLYESEYVLRKYTDWGTINR